MQGWNHLPSEILRLVFESSSDDFWRHRVIASRWATAIRSFTDIQLVVTADTDSIYDQLLWAHEQAERYPAAQFTVQLDKRLLPEECAHFLQAVGHKVTFADGIQLQLSLLSAVQCRHLFCLLSGPWGPAVQAGHCFRPVNNLPQFQQSKHAPPCS